MKKTIAGITFIFMMIGLPLLAQEKKPPRLLTFLSLTVTPLILTDTALTYDAIRNHNCYEGNPLWRPLLDKPALVLGLDLAIGAGIAILAHKLYPKNKAIAWAVVFAANIIQGYFLYWHYRLRHDPRWQ